MPPPLTTPPVAPAVSVGRARPSPSSPSRNEPKPKQPQALRRARLPLEPEAVHALFNRYDRDGGGAISHDALIRDLSGQCHALFLFTCLPSGWRHVLQWAAGEKRAMCHHLPSPRPALGQTDRPRAPRDRPPRPGGFGRRARARRARRGVFFLPYTRPRAARRTRAVETVTGPPASLNKHDPALAASRRDQAGRGGCDLRELRAAYNAARHPDVLAGP